MNVKKATITLKQENRDFISRCLAGEIPMGINDTIVNTINFGNEIEMDIKVCGANNETPWTEAVLFEHGREVAVSEPSEEYFGDWDLAYKGNLYIGTIA